MSKPITNIFTVDLEAYFCALNLRQACPPSTWETLPNRVEKPLLRLLDMLAKHSVEATFFILGWLAERQGDLIREIESRGHEIASHGYGHLPIAELSPEAFEADVRKSLAVLKQCVRQPIRGYRAPSFTVTQGTRWAWDVLARCGLKYSSSVFPIGFHPDYGMQNISLIPFRPIDGMLEIPLSCIEIGKYHIPASGGAYFRLLPYWMSRMLIRLCNRQSRQAIYYLHPWEMDSEQPRMSNIPAMKRLRHYTGLATMERKIDHLLTEFAFTSVRKAFSKEIG